MDVKTKNALTEVVKNVTDSYMIENPYGLFLVEVDGVPLCGPTLDVEEIVHCILSDSSAELFFMSGGELEVTSIRFNFDNFLGHRAGLESVNDCIVSCSQQLETYVQSAVGRK
jgi:hypothetical protein